jgi:hypothetical protein
MYMHVPPVRLFTMNFSRCTEIEFEAGRAKTGIFSRIARH